MIPVFRRAEHREMAVPVPNLASFFALSAKIRDRWVFERSRGAGQS
jgi:hypothetical protein